MAKGYSALRYPYTPPVSKDGGKSDAEAPTMAMDYLMIRRCRVQYDGKETYKGLNVPDNDVTVKKNDVAVFLAMPQQIATSYNAGYRKISPGVGGMLAMGALAAGGIDADMTNVAGMVQGAASAAMPEFTSGIAAQIGNSINQIAGLQGTIDANSIQALTAGRVFNPFSEQIFDSMAFRTHNFSFKLVARSEGEAKMINEIITYLKIGVHPKLGAKGEKIGKFKKLNEEGEKEGKLEISKSFKKIANNRFLEVPDRFDLKFIRYASDGKMKKAEKRGNLHFKIARSVCTNIAANYTPDGQYTSFKRIDGTMIQVPVIQLSLQFTETRQLTQRDVAVGY